MNSGSWASYQSAGELPDRDDEPAPGRHDHEPPRAVYVEWFQPMTFEVVEMLAWIDGFEPRRTGETMTENAPVHRWFPAERWAWKHAQAWRDAMARRHGSATIEVDF